MNLIERLKELVTGNAVAPAPRSKPTRDIFKNCLRIREVRRLKRGDKVTLVERKVRRYGYDDEITFTPAVVTDEYCRVRGLQYVPEGHEDPYSGYAVSGDYCWDSVLVHRKVEYSWGIMWR